MEGASLEQAKTGLEVLEDVNVNVKSAGAGCGMVLKLKRF